MGAHGTAAVTAEADRQHLLVRHADQGGIKAGMHDHRHQPHFHRPGDVGHGAIHAGLGADLWRHLFDGRAKEQAAEVVRVIPAAFPIAAGTAFKQKMPTGFMDDGC